MRHSYLVTLLIVSLSFSSFAQVSFKKGYYIDKKGNKTECFIKDVDWKNSPRSLDYRLTESGNTEKMNTGDIAEFAVAGTKYVHADVQYDQSSQDIKKAGVTSNPDWLKADLLLRVVVEGKAKLYHYSTPDYSLFFFSVDGSPIEQLVFKNYVNPSDVTQLAKNNLYLAQLNSRLRCAEVAPANSREVPYQLKPLANYFKDFNKCSGDVAEEAPKTSRTASIRITPGVDFSKATLHRSGVRDYNFGSNTTLRLGADLQFALPFNHGKWAIVVEPNYQYFKSNKDGGLKYQLIEIPIGIRHRFFFSETNYLFVNGMLFLDFPVQHIQTFRTGTTTTEYTVSRGAFGFSGGAGYAMGRFSLEGRYTPWRDRRDGGVMTYHYTKTTIILGIRVF